jgi:hypothetical protein
MSRDMTQPTTEDLYAGVSDLFATKKPEEVIIIGEGDQPEDHDEPCDKHGHTH